MKGRRQRRIAVEEIQFGGKLSRWIQRRRSVLAITQAQLAQTIEVSVDMVRRWESASAIPNAYHYRRLTEVLGARAER